MKLFENLKSTLGEETVSELTKAFNELLLKESVVDKTPPEPCGEGIEIVKSTLLLFVSPVILEMEFRIVGDGAAPAPSNCVANP